MAGEWKKALEAIKDPAKKAELEKALSDVGEFADELDRGYMRQADYSRKQDELQKRKETLEENWKIANEEYVAALKERDEAVADRDSTAAEKAEAEKKLKEAEAKMNESKVDTSKFLSKEDFEKEQRKVAAAQTAYFGEVLEIGDEHRDLFGSRINSSQLIQDAIAAGKSPRAFWEEKYGVQAKRDEINKTADEKRIAEAEKRGYEKRLSEEANPNLREPDASKNPFYEVPKDGKTLQPWDEDGSFDAEKEFVKELQQARG